MRHAFQGVPIFAGLETEALDLLLQGAQKQISAPGEVIVREGDRSNRIFIIAEGEVRVCKNFGQPDEIELARLGPKEFFGEMCILETLPRAATVDAAIESTVYSISSIAFHRLYQQLPAQYSILILNIARDLSRRLRHLDEAFAAKH